MTALRERAARQDPLGGHAGAYLGHAGAYLGHAGAYLEDRHTDLWERLLLTFGLVYRGDERLGVPALNGELFAPEGLPLLTGGVLDPGERALREDLPRPKNSELLRALRLLTHVERDGALERINYKDLEVEEIGHVYEGVLALAPRLVEGRYTLESHLLERKASGSYYTPRELVQVVLQESLVPVVEARLKAAGEDPKAQEEALLSLKVVDPAMGSGAFLISALEYLAEKLLEVRGQGKDDPEALYAARHLVASRCLYGVDLNPMAVELAKLSLWIASAAKGKPLSFLDHHLKVGNSLVGAPEDFLKRGIPKEAYDREGVPKEARKGLSFGPGAGSLLFPLPEPPSLDFEEETVAQVEEKRRRYREWRESEEVRKWELLADYWTAAFFLRPAPGVRLPDAQGLNWLVQQSRASLAQWEGSSYLSPPTRHAIEAAKGRHRFFHWWLEFPEVFQKGGFDVVLGNPPWERLEGETYFYRRSGAYPLTSSASGLNTYLLFLERVLALRHADGFIGLLVPTGIGTDAGGKTLFQHLWDGGFLRRLLDFENRKGLFPDVDRRFRFSSVVVGPPYRGGKAMVGFFLQEPEEANDPHRVFPLDEEALSLFNPNSRTLSSFRTRQDYLLNRLIYGRAGVFIRGNEEGEGANPWMATPVLLFSSDRGAGHLLPKEGARQGPLWVHEGKRFLPFLEAKMIHQYDHRYATHENGQTRPVDSREKRNPFYTPEPQYLVAEERLLHRLEKFGTVPRWFLAYRSVARATDERTVIATAAPYGAVGGRPPSFFPPFLPPSACAFWQT